MKNQLEFLQEVEERQGFPLEQEAAPAANSNRYGRHRAIDEEALRLVHQVFLLQSEQAPGVVVFAGIDHGNGCSQISASVATVLATDARRPVCLVEANFRSPALSRLFGAKNDCGFTDALNRKGPIRSFAMPVDAHGNLWMLSSGPLAADSPGLLASGLLHHRLAELRAEFGFVIIDAPPLSRYADAIALGQLADGLVLVLEAGSTRRDEAAQAVAGLRASRIPVLAAVLNKRTSPIPEKIYNRL